MSDAKRLQALQAENAKLEKLLAQQNQPARAEFLKTGQPPDHHILPFAGLSPS